MKVERLFPDEDQRREFLTWFRDNYPYYNNERLSELIEDRFGVTLSGNTLSKMVVKFNKSPEYPDVPNKIPVHLRNPSLLERGKPLDNTITQRKKAFQGSG